MRPEYVRVAHVSDIADRRAKRLQVGGEEIVLWRVEDRFYAVKNSCPHQHVPALHEGTLTGTNLTCPMHGWTFSLETGLSQTGDGRATIYEVRVEGEDVFIGL